MLFLIHLVMESRKNNHFLNVWAATDSLTTNCFHHTTTLCRLLNFSWRIFIQPSLVTLRKNLTNLVNTVCSCLRDLLGTKELEYSMKVFRFSWYFSCYSKTVDGCWVKASHRDNWSRISLYKLLFRAQLFEGRLALNPGLNLTVVSLSFSQKHFLG